MDKIAIDIIGFNGERFIYSKQDREKQKQYIQKRLIDIDIFLSSIKADLRNDKVLSENNFKRLGNILMELIEIQK